MGTTRSTYWYGAGNVPPHDYICGYCGKDVGTDRGYFYYPTQQFFIYICPRCERPTFFDGTMANLQTPGAPYGAVVAHLPPDVDALYDEARLSMSVASWTGSVLLCRKILMHIAVEKGAQAGDTFVAYVSHLAHEGYVPPGGRAWVDHIRVRGNEANHEIRVMVQEEAEELLSFTEMLLRLVYEFPGRVPAPR